MNVLFSLTRRHSRLFFKDKGMFITALITPLILLVLYATFLGNVYRDSFAASLPQGVTVSQDLIDGLVGGQLLSSLLAVCCVTVAFSANLLMVQDKVTGARKDLTVTPVKRSTLAFSYYLSTLFTTLIICLLAMVACFVYLGMVGWYLSFADILFLLADVVLLSIFGTALSGIINTFLSTQGQISAVGTIISAGYGFICGAYMPISQFSEGLRNAVAFLPGTYGTSLLRNHALRGVFSEMKALQFPDAVIEGMKDSVDCNLYFFEHLIPSYVMYSVVAGGAVLLLSVYVLLHFCRKTEH